jgi:hypothetical protein
MKRKSDGRPLSVEESAKWAHVLRRIVFEPLAKQAALENALAAHPEVATKIGYYEPKPTDVLSAKGRAKSSHRLMS